MTVDDLLGNSILDLPKNWKEEREETYYHYVVEKGKEYLNHLSKINKFEIAGNDKFGGQIPIIKIIEGVCRNFYQTIIHTIRIYLDQGNPFNAYKTFKEHFIKNQEDRFYSPDTYLSRMGISENEVFYRVRRETGEKLEKAKDLFHVPFEFRHKINTHRYGIPGYPCIYAANSVFLAHKEIGSPEINEHLYVSKIQAVTSLERPVYLLDLRNQVETMRRMHLGKPESYDGDLMRFFCTWLLTMASSIRTANDGSFKEEYILPQIVLQWINNNNRTGKVNLSGVSYSSSRIPLSDPNFEGEFYNIVVPVHHAKTKGLCEERIKQFKVSNPINIIDLTNMDNTFVANVRSIEEKCLKTEYSKTIYYGFEAVLAKKDFQTMSSE